MKMIGLMVVALVGCYSQPPQPAYPQPEEVNGPPGGGMDQPSYAQYEADSTPPESSYPSQGYTDPSYAPDASEQPAEPEPSADPQDQGYAMGPVTDGEIDATLNGYGEWVDDADYGRVWRPYATVVGADFTPYESCGSWIWTDWGWSYSCDWNWGWLPFHYGRWDWFDDGYWGWVPGYEWGPGWVDWRHGGGYVGWRPSAPEIRDHRGQHQGPTFHDHRHGVHDSNWRFIADNDFGKGHIRPHLYKDLAQGLSVTTPVVRPSIKGMTQPVRVAATMRDRLANPVWRQEHAPAGGWKTPVANPRPAAWQRPPQTFQAQQGWRQPPQQGWRQPPQRPQTWQVPPTSHPVWREPAPSWRQPSAGVRQPTYNPPSRPAYNPPSRPAYNPPSRPAYTPSWNSSRPTYTAPTYSPPSRPSYTPSAPSHSYSAPSHSYSGGSYGGGGHSYSGGGGGHSGGGGHHR